MAPLPHGAWQERTSRASQAVYVGLLAGVGALLSYACRPGTWHDDGNRRAAFFLGLLLLGLAVVGSLFAGTTVVTVDPTTRTIVTERRNRFGTKALMIPFDDIERLSVQALAGHHGTPAYHVSVRRRDGGRTALFVGFFAGQFSRSAMEARRRRIEQTMATAAPARRPF